MRLRLFKPLWGHPGTLAEAIELARAADFDGIEGPVPLDAAARREFVATLRGSGLDYIAEVSATGFVNPDHSATVADQLEDFERRLGLSLEAGPLFITTMAGYDLWSFGESVAFLGGAQEIARRHGVRVAFETHRSRSLYHPIVARELLRELPGLEITCDFSHWCVVTEQLVLDVLPDVLALCAERAIHIHGRIGYDQGAQVPDPRAPEYRPAVEAHFRWWRVLWEGMKRRGMETATMTPESGPDGYLHEEPFTRKPVADLWEINKWVGREARNAAL